MKVEFLGTGSITSKENSASYLINDNILLDCPNGCCKNIEKLGANVLNIDTVIITHAHGDHIFDLPFLMLWQNKYLNRAKRLKIIGPSSLEEKIRQLFKIAFSGELSELADRLKYKFVDANFLNGYILDEEKNIILKSTQVLHGDMPEAYGYVIEDKTAKVCFSGDTAICRAVVDMVDEADIAILDNAVEIGNKTHMGVNDITDISRSHPGTKIYTTHMSNDSREAIKSAKLNNVTIPIDGYIFDTAK